MKTSSRGDARDPGLDTPEYVLDVAMKDTLDICRLISKLMVSFQQEDMWIHASMAAEYLKPCYTMVEKLSTSENLAVE